MMKAVSRILILAAVLASVLSATWIFIVSPPPPFPHRFEVEMSPSVNTVARVHYQRGAGWRDSESAAQAVDASDWLVTVRLILPPGKFRGIRFSPLSEAGSVLLRDARIVTFEGRTVRRFSAEDFQVGPNVVASTEKDGAIHLRVQEATQEPQLSLAFDPILRLSLGFWSNFKLQFPRWGSRAAGLFSLLSLLGLSWHFRRSLWGLAGTRLWMPHSPFRSLTMLALAAAALASYPVVFFQKSFLSPANGALLLYDRSPTVPGSYDLRPEEAYGSDVGAMHWQHLPYSVITRRAIFEHRELPLWNRYNSAGVTLIGQGQSMIGDPIQWLVNLAGSESWAFDIKYVLCKALFALGVGWCVWLLTRDLKAAAIITFSGAFVAFYNFRTNHPAIFSFSYSPWVLVAWLHIVQSQTRRAFTWSIAGWFLANWTLINSGTVKEAYLLCASLNVSGLTIFLISRESWQSKLRRGLILLGLAVAFCLATAPLWMSFLDALKTSRTFYDIPVAYQHRSDWLVGLFDDLFLRELNLNRWVVTPAANFIILLGCLCAVLQLHRLATNPRAIVLLAGLLLSAGAAFNWIPPGWIVQIPFAKNAHHVHTHFSCIAIVHAAVLAGWGFSAARQPLTSRWRNWFIAGIAAVMLMLLARYFLNDVRPWIGGNGFAGWRGLFATHSFFYLQVLLLVLAPLGLLWVASQRLRGARLSVGLSIVLVIATAAIIMRHGQHLPFKAPAGFFRFPGARAHLLTPSPATEYLARAVSLEPARVVGIVNCLFTGFSAVYGLETANGPDAVLNPYFRDLLLAAKLPAPHDWRFAVWPQQVRDVTPALDFFNVRYIGALPGTGLNLAQHTRVATLDLDLYRSETAWPRAFFTAQVETYGQPAELMERVFARSAGPFAAIQADDVAAQAAFANHSDLPSLVEATDYKLTANTTEFTIAADRPGIAVLHEAWLPRDFIAKLDGVEVPYFRVNHAFKAVAIPSAGVHRVRFEYWPARLSFALTLGAIGFVLFAIVCLVSSRYSFQPAPTAPRDCLVEPAIA